MQKFRNVLFISQGLTDETESLNQAISIAFNNRAELKALIICHELPKEMVNYKEKYETSLIEQLNKSIQRSRDIVQVSETDIPVTIQVDSGSTPAVRIVRHVLKDEYDLVIKQADLNKKDTGFMALDMELLRKCPCPVWLCRSISKHRNEMKVAVAIDPDSISSEAYDLSLRLLKISRFLADTCNGKLHIISCWDYEFEKHLRRNVWIRLKDDEVDSIIYKAKSQHYSALDELIQKSGISGEIQIYHERGRADQMIPQFIQDQNMDILVMGTVARTGVSGFIIGNTAENIVQKIGCSLLAMKPNGFISPVKAY